MRRWFPVTSLAPSLVAFACAAASIEGCRSFGVTDVPSTDAGPDAPATADGGGPAADAASGFCSGHGDAEVCSDFDGTNEVQGWHVDQVGGTVQTVGTLSRSPPRSLRLMLQGNVNTAARLTRALPSSAKRVRLSFQLELGQGALVDMQQVSVAEIYCNGGTDEGAYVFVEGRRFDVVAHAGNGGNVLTTLPPLLASGWTRVVLDARFDLTPPIADISIGGAASTRVTIADSCASAPVFEVRVGLSTYTSFLGEAFLDDVLLELNPPGP